MTERQRDTASECDEDTDTDDNGENEHNEHGSPAVSSSSIGIPHPAVRDAASARQRSATADTASEHDSTLCDDSSTALSSLCDDSSLAPSTDAGCVSDTAAGKDAGRDDGVVPGATASSWSMRGTAYSALSWVSGVVSRSFVREQQLSNNDYNHNPGQTTADDTHPNDTNPSPSPYPNPGHTTPSDNHPSDTNPSPSFSHNPNCSEIAASDTHPNDTSPSPSPNPNPGYTAASDNHPHDTNPSSNPNFDRSENTAGDSFVHHSSTEQVADNLQTRADGDDVDVATDVHVDVQAGNVSDEQAASVADAATERASSSARLSEASSSPVARPSEASSSSVADAATERASSSARPSEASSSSCSDDVFDVISAEEVSDSSLYPLPDPRYILAARRCLPHYCQTVAIF